MDSVEKRQPKKILYNMPKNTIKIKTGKLVPMLCIRCGKEGINRISMSVYNNNGFFCPCGFEVGYA